MAADGTVRGVVPSDGASTVQLRNRALFPGLVNAHSHAFQRLLRGRTEFQSSASGEDFWSWRGQMYRVANALQPDDVFVASRQAFVEMALAGITAVGEFHYLHHSQTGQSYQNVNELAHQVIQAATEVGVRLTLLRVGYGRSGFQLPPNPGQARFIDRSVEDYLVAVEKLKRAVSGDPLVSVGLAPHSIRAVPKSWIKAIAASRGMPVHMHVAEQPAEIAACVQEYGCRPVELLNEVGILSERFTAVHAIHLNENELELLAQHGVSVCACPTTERNLGDGVIEADHLVEKGISIALGSDSQATIDLIHEARLVEEHLRLHRMRRAVLAKSAKAEDYWANLFAMASANGAHTLSLSSGTFQPGRPADFFTVDIEHPSIIGADESNLLAAILFGSERSAIREVAVQGRLIVRDGRHPLQEQSGRAFASLAHRIFA